MYLFLRMKLVKLFLLPFASCILYLAACTTIDLYEKNATIPGHSWKSSFTPSFSFVINDTTRPYELLLVLRHTEKYNYTNIYINLYVQAPGDTVRKIQFDLPLAGSDGWTGTGMDDIYEHRISLNKGLAENNFSVKRKGEYHFRIEQIMREDPLKEVLNAGIRIEKK